VKARIFDLMARIDALATRERVLVFAAMVVVVGGLLLALLVSPAQQRLAQMQRETAAAEGRIADLQVQIDQLSQRAAIDPDEENRRKLEQLRARIADVDVELREKTLEFISPAQMARVVEDLVSRTSGLELVAVQSEPARVVEGLVAADAEDQAAAPKIYRHGLTVELRGSYHAVLDYAQALEALPWRLFWEDLELTTEAYPQAAVRIRLYTLSLNEGWIGV
jgi:MSHA biogenesis protein MshJ